MGEGDGLARTFNTAYKFYNIAISNPWSDMEGGSTK